MQRQTSKHYTEFFRTFFFCIVIIFSPLRRAIFASNFDFSVIFKTFSLEYVSIGAYLVCRKNSKKLTDRDLRMSVQENILHVCKTKAP